MDKRDYFDSIIGKVCESTGISVGEVCRSNREECVDARYLVIHLLSERLSDRQIADASGWSVQLVSKVRNSFENRCRFRWGLKELYLYLRKE